MDRKIVSLLVGLCLVSGILVAVAPSAQAQRPFGITQFEPNDTSVAPCAVASPPGCTADYLSDKFDGVDSLAHLTAVATPETTQVTWYVCPLGTSVTTQAALASCNVTIGTDPTGFIPFVGPGVNTPVDEAFDVTWDIPGSLDQQRRDIAALACIGTNQQIEGDAANCRVDEEDSIFLEDAQTGAAANQTTSGEFGPYRTLQACIGVAPGDAACDAAYKAFPHGGPVPNDGFDFQAFTSPDVQALSAGINTSSDAQSEPSAGNVFSGVVCNLQQELTNFKRWRCELGDADVPEDSELAISLLNNTTGGALATGNGGYCNSNNNPGNGPPPAQFQVPGAHDNCVLDVHYAVSSTRQPARVTQSFEPNPPSPRGTAGCFQGRTPDTDETSELGTTENFMICMVDQFDDPFAGRWTEETVGAGRISGCGPYTAHDHNGDGLIDDCHGSTGGPLGASSGMQVANATGPTGDQVVTSCFDPQNQAATPPPPNHGCADAPANLKATLTVHWGTTPSEVFLAFNDPAPTDAADPCRTGVTFKRNLKGEHDDVTACTFDSSGNPVPTDTNATRLQWQIFGAHGEEPTAVRFNPAPPPQETTGPGASAQAGIDAVEDGDNFIRVILLDANGDQADFFDIEKQVFHGDPRPRDVPTVLTAEKSGKFIRGKAQTEGECRPGRQVTLFRRRRARDSVIDVDTTNSFGRWGVRTGKRRGTYYARVAAGSATDVETGFQLNCLPDQSPDVRRR